MEIINKLLRIIWNFRWQSWKFKHDKDDDSRDSSKVDKENDADILKYRFYQEDYQLYDQNQKNINHLHKKRMKSKTNKMK